MSYCYIIGGVGFEFEIDKKLIEYFPYDVFHIDCSNFAIDEKHHFIFSNDEYVLPADSRLIISSPSADVYETEKEYIQVNKRFDEVEYTCTVVSPKTGTGGIFFYSTGNFEKLKVTTEFFRCCDLLSSLLYYNALILHCAYIIFDGKAILFSAPSEGGKSTQASLWEKYQGAEIINGDRAVIKKEKDGWYVYSLPFCGSSAICKNKSAKLGSIVFVNKSDIDSVEQLGNIQKLSMIMQQLNFENKKQQNFEKVMSLVDDLISTQKIVMLNCGISDEATKVLRKEIDSYE